MSREYCTASHPCEPKERCEQHGGCEYSPSPKCTKCGGEMEPGKALDQTWTGLPDFVRGEVVTMARGGLGKLIDCLKCRACGFSVK